MEENISPTIVEEGRNRGYLFSESVSISVPDLLKVLTSMKSVHGL